MLMSSMLLSMGHRGGLALMVAAMQIVCHVGLAGADDAMLPPAVENAEIVYAVDAEATFFEIARGPIVKREVVVGMSSHKVVDTHGYIGRLLRRQYRVVDTASSAEIHTHYSKWLAGAGYVIRLDAVGDKAMSPGGTSWALRVYGNLPTEIVTELSGTLDKTRRRYLVAEKHDGDQHRAVTVLISPRRMGDTRVQVDLIDIDTQATDRAFPTKSALVESLAVEDGVALDGIRYLGKKTVPLDSADQLLRVVAELLGDQPALKLTIESREHIEALASARADAIKQLLISEHAVEESRLMTRATRPADAALATGITIFAVR